MKREQLLQRLRLIGDLFRVDGAELHLIEVALANLHRDIDEEAEEETVGFLHAQTIRSRARSSLFFELKEHCLTEGGLLTLKELEQYEELDRRTQTRRFGS